MIKNLLLVFTSILISVLIVEGALRLIYTPAPLETRMNMVDAGVDGGDSTVNWDSKRLAYEPMQSATIAHVEYNNTATVDRYGFRNPCLQEPITGLLVGDSSVFGIGVDDEDTFQCVNARLGINSYTMGVPGAPPSYLIRLVEEHGKSLREEFTFSEQFYVQYFLSLGNDFAKLAAFGNQAPPREGTESKSPESAPQGESFYEWANKLVYHDSILRFSYVLQMLKLVAITAAPQCSECNYLDLRGGDRVYKKTVTDEEAERHVNALLKFMDTAAEAALKVGATQVQFILIRGAHIVSARRMDKELRLQGAAAEDFNLAYQSDIFTRAASQRPQITVFDSTPCLQEYPQVDDLHYQFDGHFTKTGIQTFMNCLPRPAMASTR